MKKLIKTALILIIFLLSYIASALLVMSMIFVYLKITNEPLYFFIISQILDKYHSIFASLATFITIIIYSLVYKLKHENLSKTWNFSKVSNIDIMKTIIFGISTELIIIILLTKFFSYNSFLVLGNPANFIDNRIFQLEVTQFVIFTSLIVPLVEEILYRGILFNELKRNISLTASIFIQAVLFTVMHDIISMPGAFILAILNAYMYNKYKSMWIPFTMHSATNLTSITFSIFNGKLIIDNLGFLLLPISIAIFVFCLWLTFRGDKVYLTSNETKDIT